jgi:hypothetical protein
MGQRYSILGLMKLTRSRQQAGLNPANVEDGLFTNDGIADFHLGDGIPTVGCGQHDLALLIF